MFVVALLLAFGASWRVARLITTDKLTAPLRVRAEARGPLVGYLFECSWCISIWTSPLLVVPAVVWPTNRVVLAVLACLTASGLSGFMATIEDRLDR